MRLFVPFVLLLAAGAAPAGADPVTECRAVHGDDPPAHVACLEEALRAASAAVPPARPVPAAAPATPTPPAAATAGAPGGLGAEQARQRQRRPDDPLEQVAVRIVSVTYNAAGRGIFHMEDGQVWLETETTSAFQRLVPGQQYTARIEPGRIGGYRMYVDGVRRMIKLERLR